MKFTSSPLVLIAVVFGWSSQGWAEVKVVIEHRAAADTTASFRLRNLPPARKSDTGSRARFMLAAGERDPNGGGLEQLQDGRLPSNEDEPRSNFFFRAGTDGGRIVADLEKPTDLMQVNSYSWHPGTRGPQVYSLYAATGSEPGFESAPRKGTDPAACGWRLLATVDTRGEGDPGGQYAVSIRDTGNSLGTWRYLLFDVRQTEATDPFGNTFYSEIDLMGKDDAEEIPAAETPAQVCEEIIETGGFTITVETTETPDLTEWVRNKVVPMAREWYPRLVEMLPSEGFAAPRTVRITFSKDMRGVAATGGTRIRCAAGWFRQNLEGEAVGAVFHELVHVVQQYGRAKPLAEGASRPPGWLVEGIADYLRWFRFQPQDRGAEITSRNLARARYDGNYRITANFLNWATETRDRELVPQLNAAIREGRYSERLWQERTRRTVQELGEEWRSAMEKKVTTQNKEAAQ